MDRNVLGGEKGCVPVLKIFPLVAVVDKYKKLGGMPRSDGASSNTPKENLCREINLLRNRSS